MRILIAANACLLVLENDATLFESVTQASWSIPPEWWSPSHHRGQRDRRRSETPILGQARFNGPIILSWSDSIYASQRIGTRNVVLHEFAHALDMLNGTVNGTPPMRKGLHDVDGWRPASRNTKHLRARLDDGVHLGRSIPYGATNPGEFFAVVTEHFFEQPHVLHDHHPALWEVFGGVLRVRLRRRLRGRSRPLSRRSTHAATWLLAAAIPAFQRPSGVRRDRCDPQNEPGSCGPRSFRRWRRLNRLCRLEHRRNVAHAACRRPLRSQQTRMSIACHRIYSEACASLPCPDQPSRETRARTRPEAVGFS